MKIGIVGPAERAVAWEQNLRHHVSVTEVEIARSLSDIGDVDACLLIDDSEARLQILLQAVKEGYHSFLVSKLPLDTAMVEKIYHASEESNVMVQFSHWPTLAPASQWMFKKIQKPNFIQVVREINHTDFMERDTDMRHYWIDELAFCITWIDGINHSVQVNRTGVSNVYGEAAHFHLRFDSGATANIFITTVATQNNHKRTAADHAHLLDCDVLEQTVRAGQANEHGHLFFKKQTFDASKSAELASSHFLKAIQMRKSTPFGAYDLFRTLKVVDKINRQLQM